MFLPLGLAAVAGANEFTGNIVVHGTSPARAAQIRAAAEQVRSAAFGLLLGNESPRRWIARCAIHVHATPDAFAAAVGMPIPPACRAGVLQNWALMHGIAQGFVHLPLPPEVEPANTFRP